MSSGGRLGLGLSLAKANYQLGEARTEITQLEAAGYTILGGACYINDFQRIYTAGDGQVNKLYWPDYDLLVTDNSYSLLGANCFMNHEKTVYDG